MFYHNNFPFMEVGFTSLDLVLLCSQPLFIWLEALSIRLVYTVNTR